MAKKRPKHMKPADMKRWYGIGLSRRKKRAADTIEVQQPEDTIAESEKPAAVERKAEKPAAARPAVGQSTAARLNAVIPQIEMPAAEKPAVVRPVTGQPMVARPAAGQPATRPSVGEKPEVARQRIVVPKVGKTETVASEARVALKPTVEQPAATRLQAMAPQAEKAVTPVVDMPVAKNPEAVAPEAVTPGAGAVAPVVVAALEETPALEPDATVKMQRVVTAKEAEVVQRGQSPLDHSLRSGPVGTAAQCSKEDSPLWTEESEAEIETKPAGPVKIEAETLAPAEVDATLVEPMLEEAEKTEASEPDSTPKEADAEKAEPESDPEAATTDSDDEPAPDAESESAEPAEPEAEVVLGGQSPEDNEEHVVQRGQSPKDNEPEPEATESDVEPTPDETAPAEEVPAESDVEPMGAASEQSVNRSAALISGLVIVSRLTGFLRTWAQAHALGVTIIASCYAVANNLPNQLYELVIGGMLVTAFLPVYLSEKAKGGRAAGNAYASNLSTIVLVLMGAVTLACIGFAAPIVFTQSFSAQADFDANLAVYFFRFFAVEVLLYSLSSVFSGVLNAEREYVWSSAAPILNNVVVSASFIVYAALVNSNPGLALLILALGNPLGVLVQVVIQLPAMYARGIRLRPHINLRDPAIRDTLSIGIPSLVVMLSSFVTVSVMTSSSLSVTPVGASVSYYARLWYTLPYSVLAVPVTTTMFTELSHVYSAGDKRAFCKGVVSGTSRILFLLTPFMMYLVVFAVPLVTLLAAGGFEGEGIGLTASYLQALSLSLPAYGVCMYLQKVFSSLREMAAFAAANVVAGILQVAVCLLLTQFGGLNVVALSSLVFFVAVDLFSFVYLKSKLGRLRLGPIVAACVRSLIFGTLGALAAMAVMWALTRAIGPLGDSAARAVMWCVAGGIPAVVVSFGLQILLKTPESSFFRSMVRH